MDLSDLSISEVAWWSMLGIVIIVAVAVVVQLVRAYREVRRIQRHVAALTTSPLVAALEKAAADAARLEVARAELEALLARARVALAQIRGGPIPPDVVEATRGVRAAAAELRHLGFDYATAETNDLGKVGLEPT